MLILSGCSLGQKPKANQPDLTKESECFQSADCELPAEFAVQSNCPYQAFCENKQCVVACLIPKSLDDYSEKLSCQKSLDCSCDSWDQEKKFRCACLDGSCASVVKDSNQAVIDQIEIPILIYHHIDSDLPPANSGSYTFYVLPAEFEKQMAYLKDNGFQGVSMFELSQAFADKFVLPQKPVIITFDDGLPSQYQNALPVLEKYNLSATFYIFANPIGKSKNYLDWDQVRELEVKGMEIGSHGWYHQYFSQQNLADLKREIFSSKEKIETELGKEIYTISYPFGDKDATSTQMIKSAGYTSARDIVNGKIQTKDDLYKLRGYFITNDFARFVSILNN